MAFNLQIYEEITNLQKNIPETEFHAKLNLTFYHKYDNHKHDNHKFGNLYQNFPHHPSMISE